jgi:hypothetical protein
MLTPENDTRSETTEYRTASSASDTDRPVAPQREDIYLRNFDSTRAYNLTVEVRDGDSVKFINRYYLTPGQTVSECGQLPPGAYEVQVVLDGRRQQTVQCDIGTAPERTALIEVGNGTVSVTEGLYGCSL